MAILANAIDALDRVLVACGHQGELVGSTPCQAPIVLFYRNELREYLLAELRKADRPLSSRELALSRLPPVRWQRPGGQAASGGCYAAGRLCA